MNHNTGEGCAELHPGEHGNRWTGIRLFGELLCRRRGGTETVYQGQLHSLRFFSLRRQGL